MFCTQGDNVRNEVSKGAVERRRCASKYLPHETFNYRIKFSYSAKLQLTRWKPWEDGLSPH
jgi:hypothetical protein